VASGRILGHEAVGTVVSVGSGVKTLTAGDRVLVSCVSACGRCRFVTHHFALDDITAAYDTFSRAADTGAIKVVMTRS
jgi:threonine dehydrogenase-like Zn-dependent dehydrogenase